MKKKNVVDAINRIKGIDYLYLKKIFIYPFIQLSILFVIAVFLKEMGFLPSYLLDFILFGLLLPLFALPILMDLNEPSYDIRIKSFYLYIGIIIIFIFVILVRLIPYSTNSIPLGYDPGYYKYAMDTYLNALPGIPEAALPLWMKQMHEQGFFVLFDELHLFTGIDSMKALIYLLPFFSALLILPIFILTRKIFDDKAALIACALYAVSYTQFTAFTFMYLRNILGIFFLLLALYALEKKNYVFIAIMFAALGIYHRPEFLIFSLILICYYLKTRDRYLIYSIILAAFLIFPFWLPRIETVFPLISGLSNTMIQNIQAEPTGGGTFFDIGKYEWLSLVYLPFGFIGAFYMISKKMWNSLFFYFVINGVIIAFRLFFYNRLLIDFDIALLILASAGITCTFLAGHKISRVTGTAFIILLLFSGGTATLQNAHDIKPLMNEDQIKAIEWIANNTDENAYILATSYDAPWVLAWGKRKILAPGLFEWDGNGKGKWLEFLGTGNSTVAQKFLKKYNNDVYIYYSFNKFNRMNLEKFNNTAFTKNLMKDSVIYHYVNDDDGS
ncbi:Dolichyl-phosphate-mannose-protein mannosyltransferase [uncultured archaeon]|nr:Dolichyl-phosphate-mannose-protein mannosyltransferase [uncultured archaeon]